MYLRAMDPERVPPKHFFLRLLPPRPTFPFDMTEDERRLMGEHGAYLRTALEAGRVLVYGPVLAEEGPFGMAVIEAVDEADARQFVEGDPTVRAGLNRFSLAPMRVGGERSRPAP